jgi:hypothetical protein
MAGQMKNAMEQSQTMMQNREMTRTREMERDMERLRKHLSDMTGQMEDAVQLMERMTNRVQARVSMKENN